MKPEEFFKSERVRETLGDRSWLASKTKEELMDLITYIVYEYFERNDTANIKTTAPETEHLDFGKREISKDFLVLPIDGDTGPDVKSWRIALVSTLPDKLPLSLEIVGRAVIGLRSLGYKIDLDLTEYQGRERGVSRRHAAFEPTDEQLYVKDFGSTNGTFVNKQKVGLDGVPLEDGDILVLGDLFFKVKIIKTP